MKPVTDSLLLSLSQRMNRLVSEAEQEIEAAIDINRKKRRDVSTQHLVKAHEKIQEIRAAAIKLSDSAMDFERLFNQFYNDAIALIDDENKE